MINCYPSPGKRKGMKMCESFAKGCGGRVLPVGHAKLEPGAAFFYGWTSHSAPLIERCRAEGRTWFYADNAYYFGRGRYFRVTRNDFMDDGSGAAGPARFKAFGLTVKPWQRGGKHIVVTTQSEAHYKFRCGTTRAAWTSDVITRLRCCTERPIRICHKPDAVASRNAPAAASFEADLDGAWAVVAHCSSTMVKALLDGVPVFSLAPSMASRMGWRDLTKIETPIYPDDREQWLANLAANQWTYDELSDGTCWRDLQRQQEK